MCEGERNRQAQTDRHANSWKEINRSKDKKQTKIGIKSEQYMKKIEEEKHI